MALSSLLVLAFLLCRFQTQKIWLGVSALELFWSIMSKRHLQTHITSDSGFVQLSTRGETASYRNERAEGCTFLAHRPDPGDSRPFALDARLKQFGTSYCFELQIQIRFKCAPRGPLWLMGELREGPMKLNLVTRSLCRMLLGIIKQQARKRGVDFRYSFGDGKTNPNIAIPVFAADRIIFSDDLLQLPLDTKEDKGTWKMQDGQLVGVDRGTMQLKAGSCMTIFFATSFLDFERWSITNVPGVGNLDLTQFWGSQPLHLLIFDEGAAFTGAEDKRIFFELQMASVVGHSAPVEKSVESETYEDDLKDVVMELLDADVEQPDAVPMGQVSSLQHEVTDRITCYTDGDGQSGQDSSSDSGDDLKGPDEDWEFKSCISMNSRRLIETLNAQQQNFAGDLEDYSGYPDAVVDRVHGHKSGLVAIPWYFCNCAGDLWWCIDYKGRICWRHHSQLQALCINLGSHLPKLGASSSIRNLEFGRRLAARLLTQGSEVPGLLEEFTEMEVSFTSLLSGVVQQQGKSMFIGLVEAEGRIVERCIQVQAQTLQWSVVQSGRRRKKIQIAIDLREASLHATNLVGARALQLGTPHKNFILVAKEQHQRPKDMCLHSLLIDGMFHSLPQELAATPTLHKSEVPASLTVRSRVGCAIVEAASHMPRASRFLGNVMALQHTETKKLHLPGERFKDALSRWPANRIVINDAEPCLDTPAGDPVAFSAAMLRGLLAAQENPEMVHEWTIRSGGLKCIDLGHLGEQDLWCFWVNVFHSLVVHAQLVAGRPRSIQQIVAFYNTHSYLVAGHVFSLVEIEHSILRHHMTKPRIRFASAVLKIWPRSGEDLENRPCCAAPMCAANCFACRPDWRLNLVLNAGNCGCADAVPVFESLDTADFDKYLQHAMQRTLSCCGSVNKDLVELPYNLYRYRDDAPDVAVHETPERRWVRAILHDTAQNPRKITYRKMYDWTMRQRLGLM